MKRRIRQQTDKTSLWSQSKFWAFRAPGKPLYVDWADRLNTLLYQSSKFTSYNYKITQHKIVHIYIKYDLEFKLYL